MGRASRKAAPSRAWGRRMAGDETNPGSTGASVQAHRSQKHLRTWGGPPAGRVRGVASAVAPNDAEAGVVLLCRHRPVSHRLSPGQAKACLTPAPDLDWPSPNPPLPSPDPARACTAEHCSCRLLLSHALESHAPAWSPLHSRALAASRAA